MRETSSNLIPIHVSKDIRGGDKKVMKKILSVALSTAMAFSMFASVAFADEAKLDTQGKYDFLKDKGVFNGNPDGSAALDKEMTRAEFAKVITKLYGLDEITGVLTYKDKNYKEGVWFVPFIEAVTKAGLMEGKPNGLFDPNGKVTVEEMAKVLAIAFKLEIPTDADNSASPWAKGYVAAAVKAGLIPADANFKGNALRGLLVDASYIAYQAINIQPKEVKVVDSKNIEVTFTDGDVEKVALTTALEANKETEVKVTHKGKEYSVKATWVVTDLEVKNVTTTNFAEIDIEFNTDVDADSISKDNIKIDRVALGTNDTTSVIDGKTVRIYRSTGFTTAQDAKKKISISGIKSKQGKEMTAVVDRELTFSDKTFPELVSAVATGNKKIDLTFSEPIKNDTDAKIFANYKIDGNYIVGVNQPSVSGRTITLELASSLSAGEHKIAIVGNKLSDFSGLKAFAGEVTVTVAEDKTAPTATIKEVSPEKVVVEFSEEVKSADVYWMDGVVKKSATFSSKDSSNKAITTYTFAAGTYLPLTSTKLYVENAEDWSGNKASKMEFEVKAVPDTARPEAAKAESSKEREILVTFSKGVNAATGIWTLKNKDGNVVSVTRSATDDVKVVKLTSNDITPGNGPFTLTVKEVEDNTSLKNKSLDQVFTIAIPDKTAPYVPANAVGVVDTTDKKVTITFDDKVDLATASDVLNYSYFETGKGYVALPVETSVTVLSDGKTVVLTFPTSWSVDGNTVQFTDKIRGQKLVVRNIKDLAGNAMISQEIQVPNASTGAASVSGAVATGANTIEVSLAGGLLPTTAYAGDFDVVAESRNLTVTGATLDGSKIILTVYQSLNASGKNDANGDKAFSAVTVSVKANPAATRTALNEPIFGSSTVTDGIRADVESVAFGTEVGATAPVEAGVDYPATASNQIRVIFNENLKTVAANTDIASALVIKNKDGARILPGNYTVQLLKGDKSAATNDGVTADIRTLLITFTQSGLNTTISDLYLAEGYFKDANNNFAKAFNKASAADKPVVTVGGISQAVTYAASTTTVGQTVLTFGTLGAGSSYVYKVANSPASPAVGTAAANAFGTGDAGTALVSGASISPTAGQYVTVAELNNGVVVGYSAHQVVASDLGVNAPAITTATKAPGSATGKTAITYTAGTGNTLKVVVSTTGAVPTPVLGSVAPGAAYTSGDDLTVADTNHVGLYEVDAAGKVVKFVDLTIGTADIAV